MAEQIVTLNPGESKVVSFEATPHEEKTYQVSVDGLTGSFKAVAPVGVQITSITVSPTSLTDRRHEYQTYLGLGYWGDPFTISITFSNPFNYDVWVRPDFAFGNLTGEPLEYVEEIVRRRRELVLKGFTPAPLLYFRLLLDSPAIQGDYSSMGATWQKLYHPQNNGSNMPQFVYDPDGIPVLMAGGDCWLKVPAKGEATTVKQGHIGVKAGLLTSGSLFGWTNPYGWVWKFYNNCVPGKEYLVKYVKSSDRPFDPTKPMDAFEVYEPTPRVFDVCVKVDKCFYLVYDPGWATRTVGGITVTVNYRPISLDPFASAIQSMIEIVAFHGDYESNGTIYTHRWQRYIGTIDTTQLKFEDATPPGWW